MTRLVSQLFVSALISILFLAGCNTKIDDGLIPITTESDSARKLYLQGRDMQERLLSQQSRGILEKCVAEDPEFALGYLALTLSQPTHKDSMESIRLAVKYSENASEGERLLILAYVAALEGDLLAQGRNLRKLVSSYPKDARAHDLLGNYYYKQQKYSEAITQYTKAIALSPDFSAPYNNLGYSYRAIGKYDEAAKTFQQYIQLIPNDPNPYDSYAELLMKMGRFDDSIKNYRKALEVRPDFTFSHVGIASDLTYLGESDEARKELAILLDEAEDDGQRREAFTAIALTYAHDGDYDNTIRAIKQQFELASKEQDIATMASDLNMMGDVYYEAGKYDEADANFAQAHEIVASSELPDNLKQQAERTILYNEARIALKRKDLETAQAKTDAYSRAAVKTGDPNQIRQSHELMGMLALAKADYKTAISEFELGNLENAYSLYNLALAYEGSKDKDKALEFSKKAANFNELDEFNYAFVRMKARALADKLSNDIKS